MKELMIAIYFVSLTRSNGSCTNYCYYNVRNYKNRHCLKCIQMDGLGDYLMCHKCSKHHFASLNVK